MTIFTRKRIKVYMGDQEPILAHKASSRTLITRQRVALLKEDHQFCQAVKTIKVEVVLACSFKSTTQSKLSRRNNPTTNQTP